MYLYIYSYFTIILDSEVREDLLFLYKSITCHDENLLNKKMGQEWDTSNNTGPRSRVMIPDPSNLTPVSAA